MADRFCVKQRPYFSDRLDGARVPFWRGLLVRFHLRICPPCRRYHRSLEATRDALCTLRDRDVDPDR
ncbi:MAG TPA: anti-sigma factor [Polyangia bacterium]|jgi:predicted anti-sigma-YlaC factor YlaD|nr:anti-sigma factor [Polyangia bacterium]